MVWCVVHFTLENTVEVVPALWYRKEGNCAWPKTSKIKNIKMAVINKIRPNKHDFSFYEARCLASNIDNFSIAQKKCDIAKCTSDLSSEMEDTKLKQKRKSRRKIKNCSTSESESEQSDSHYKNKNAVPCYHSDSEPQLKTKYYNKSLSQTAVGIECRPNGWSPLKSSIFDSAKKETIIMSNTRTIISPLPSSPLKLSDQTTSLFSEKKSSNNQNVNLLRSPSPFANSAKRCLFSDIDKHDRSLNSNSDDKLMNDPSVVSSGSGRKKLYTDIVKLNHSNSIIPNFNDTPKESVIKTSEKRSSTNSKSTIFKKADDQFKEMVLHKLIIIKHSIKNLDEKLNLLIEKSSKSSENSNINADDNIIDYSNLNCLFPIEDENTLNDIEEQLVSDKQYYKSLTQKLIGLGGKTVQIYIKRVMQLLFSDELLKSYSFEGRGNKKKCFSNLVISELIFGSIQMLKKFSYENAKDDAEKYIKYALIQAPFNIKKKNSKTPTTI